MEEAAEHVKDNGMDVTVANFKIGKIAQSVFPVLFEEGRVTQDDIEYLMSDEARKNFKSGGYQVLKETVGDPNEDARDAKGHARFYPWIMLPFGGKRYLITSQWFGPGKDNLIEWVVGHGISCERIVDICLRAGVRPVESESRIDAARTTAHKSADTGRAGKTTIRVTFPDGEVIEGRKGADVFARAVEKIGAGQVASLHIMLSGEPLVSNNAADYVKYAKALKPCGEGWWTNTSSSTKAKAQFLERIGQGLGIALQVEIVPCDPPSVESHEEPALAADENSSEQESVDLNETVENASEESPVASSGAENDQDDTAEDTQDSQAPEGSDDEGSTESSTDQNEARKEPDNTVYAQCPKCHLNFASGIEHAIDFNAHPEQLERLKNDALFTFKCPNCREEFKHGFNGLFFNFKKNYLVKFVQDEQAANKLLEKRITLAPEELKDTIRNRVVTNVAELKEKIRIFESGLDDNIIEFLKDNVIGQLKKDMDVAFALFFDVGEKGVNIGVWPKGKNESHCISIPMAEYEKCADGLRGWFSEGFMRRVNVVTVRSEIESRRMQNAVYAMYHDRQQKHSCECPECHHKFEVSGGDTFDLVQHPGDEERIIEGTLFNVPCPNCRKSVHCERPVIVVNAKKGYLIRVANNGDEARWIDKARVSLLPEDMQGKIRERNVVGNDGLQEKVAIFEARIDDNLIEVVKLNLLQNIEKNNEGNVHAISIIFKEKRDNVILFEVDLNNTGKPKLVPLEMEEYIEVAQEFHQIFSEGWVRFVSYNTIEDWVDATPDGMKDNLRDLGGYCNLWTRDTYELALAHFGDKKHWCNSARELCARILDAVRRSEAIQGDFSLMAWMSVFCASHFGLGASAEWQYNQGGFEAQAIFDMMMSKGGFDCVGEIAFEKLGSFATPVFQKSFEGFVNQIDVFSRSLMAKTGVVIPAKGEKPPRKVLRQIFFERLNMVCNWAFTSGFTAGWVAINKGSMVDECNGIQVETDYERQINLALVRNRLPLIKSIKIRNVSPEKFEHLVCVLTASDGLFDEKIRSIGRLFPHHEFSSGAIPLHYDENVLADVVTVRKTSFRIRVFEQRRLLFSKDYEIQLVAPDIYLWGVSSELLNASYVTPNAPQIRNFHAAISREMGKICDGNAEIYTYQPEDWNPPDYDASRQHSLKICEAIYRAIHALGITYADPPDCSGVDGQKFRMPYDVIGEKTATCIESTFLFASVLMECGLNPVLIMLKSHAFVGCHLLERHFSKPVMGINGGAEDCQEVRKAIEAKDFIAIETTRVGNRNKATGKDYSFGEAVTEGKGELLGLLAHPSRELEALVDVKLARAAGIHEIILDRGNANAVIHVQGREVDELPVEQVRAVERVTGTKTIKHELTGRMKLWADKLINLSSVNPLLNWEHANLVEFRCVDPSMMYRIEDGLADGKAFYMLGESQRIWESLEPSEREKGITGPRFEGIINQQFLNRCLCIVELEKKTRKSRKNPAKTRRVSKPEWVKRLEALVMEAKRAQEETGAQTLFVAIGLMKWVEDVTTNDKNVAKEESQKGKKQKSSRQEFFAPIILVPATIDLTVTNRGLTLMRRDGETILNETLMVMLEKRYNISFTEFKEGLPLDEHGINVQKIIQMFKDRILNFNDLEVCDGMAVGTFNSGSFAMRQDLVNHPEKFEQNRLIRHFISCEAGFDDQIDLFEPTQIADHLTPGQYLCPVAADSSQLRAVLYSATGKSFVLDGPPGTGKSQTITNIIAHNLAHGRRILFVAKKETALQVVKSRLEKAGLAPFCLELFADKASRVDLKRQLQDSLEFAESLRQLGTAEGASRWQDVIRRYEQARTDLDRYADVLHHPYPNGLSAYDCYARIFHAGKSFYTEFVTADVLHQSSQDYVADKESLRTVAREFANLGKVDVVTEMPELIGDDISYGFQKDLQRGFELMIGASRAAEEAAQKLERALGTTISMKPDGLEKLISGLKLLQQEGRVPENFASEVGLDVAKLKSAYESEKVQSQLGEERSNRIKSASEKLRGLDLERIKSVDVGGVRADLEAARSGGVMEKLLHRKEKKVLDKYGILFTPGEIPSLSLLSQRLDLIACYQKALSVSSANLNAGTIRSIPLTEEQLHSIASMFTSLKKFSDRRAELAKLCVPRFDGLTFGEIKALCEKDIGHIGCLSELMYYRAAKKAAVESGLAGFIELLETGTIQSHELVAEYEKAYYLRMLEEIVSRDGQCLYGFNTCRHETLIDDFNKVINGYRDLAKKAILDMIAAKYPRIPQGLTSQERQELFVINQEVKAIRSRKSIRQFMKEAGELVLKLKPCILITPEGVAQFLSMDIPLFDMVVFDEASQLHTHEAVGVMARGKQVIVTGDPKQMPPSSSIGMKSFSSEDDVDAESLLHDCDIAKLPNVTLNWHYRSQHESLIYFSNRNYYGMNLNTFPSVGMSETKGIRYHFVENGVYHDGQNCEEANAVVNRVQQIVFSDEFDVKTWSSDEYPVIGIVTFNVKQMKLVGDAIENLRKKDPKLSKVLEKRPNVNQRNPDAPYLVYYYVKNLAYVQGDEADIIIFSVGSGPDRPRFSEDGQPVDPKTIKFSSTISDLANEGGEKKLNVALTRSRKRLEVFASIKVDEIGSSERVGMKHFKEFLSEVEQTAETQSLETSESPRQGLPEIVCAAIRDAGYKCVANVGCSLAKIDLAVINPFDESLFMAGIEFDGKDFYYAHMLEGTVNVPYRNPTLDREVQRISTLNRFGWTILRVWSADWYKDVDRAKAVLLSKLEELKKKAEEDWKRKQSVLEEERLKQEREAAESQRRREEIAQKIDESVSEAELDILDSSDDSADQEETLIDSSPDKVPKINDDTAELTTPQTVDAPLVENPPEPEAPVAVSAEGEEVNLNDSLDDEESTSASPSSTVDSASTVAPTPTVTVTPPETPPAPMPTPAPTPAVVTSVPAVMISTPVVPPVQPNVTPPPPSVTPVTLSVNAGNSDKVYPLTETALGNLRSPGGVMLDGQLIRSVNSWKDCFLALCEKLNEIDAKKFGETPDMPTLRRWFVRVIPHKKYPDFYPTRFGMDRDVRVKEIASKSYFYMPTYVVYQLLHHFNIDPNRVTIKE